MKKSHPPIKSNLHARNQHRERYRLDELTLKTPELNEFIIINKYGDESIDFSDPQAVKTLNSALLRTHYGVDYWDIPPQYLCPSVPGRADYIHYIADLLNVSDSTDKKGLEINCLDIGVGANCIYPIIGVHEYDWKFVGSDIDHDAIKSARKIIDQNSSLNNKVQLYQQRTNKIFEGVVKDHGPFHISICNPPFFSSALEAKQASQRKVKNLTRGKNRSGIRNFGGQRYELWCHGGERRFVADMIIESQAYKSDIQWFTTLLSQQSNLVPIQRVLKKVKPSEVKIIPMSQGNKISRIVAWTF